MGKGLYQQQPSAVYQPPESAPWMTYSPEGVYSAVINGNPLSLAEQLDPPPTPGTTITMTKSPDGDLIITDQNGTTYKLKKPKPTYTHKPVYDPFADVKDAAIEAKSPFAGLAATASEAEADFNAFMKQMLDFKSSFAPSMPASDDGNPYVMAYPTTGDRCEALRWTKDENQQLKVRAWLAHYDDAVEILTPAKINGLALFPHDGEIMIRTNASGTVTKVHPGRFILLTATTVELSQGQLPTVEYRVQSMSVDSFKNFWKLHKLPKDDNA